MWKSSNYISQNLADVDADDIDDESLDDDVDDVMSLNYVIGDVTKPQTASDDLAAVVVHCVGEFCHSLCFIFILMNATSLKYLHLAVQTTPVLGEAAVYFLQSIHFLRKLQNLTRKLLR